MANPIKWEKPTITVEELKTILHQQYGPECPTRILIEDPSTSMKYKTGMVSCECMRCGKQFMMTPFALINSYYLSGHICTNCGNLSDNQLVENQKEDMRIKTIETLKEHGIDVLKEEFGKKDKTKPENVEEDEFSSSADADDLDINDMYKEAMEDAETSVESVTPDPDPEPEQLESEPVPQSEVEEESVADDTGDDEANDYMVSDDDYNGTLGDTIDEDTEIVEEEDIPEEEENLNEDLSRPYVDDDPEDIPEPIKDEVEAENDTGDDISEDDVFGVEEPPAEEEPIQEEVTEEPAEPSNMIWVGDEAYTEDELGEKFQEAVGHILEKLKFVPFDLESCEIKDGKIHIKCNTCGEEIEFDSFEDLASVEKLSTLLQKYGSNIPKDKFNNYKKIMPLTTACPVCLKSVIDNGFNTYHRKRVLDFCEKAHITILDADKHLFIDDSNEAFLISVNNIKKTMRWSEILYKFTDKENGNIIKDARLDPLFTVTQPKPVRSEESVKPVEQQRAKVSVEEVKVEERSKIVKDTATVAPNRPSITIEPKPTAAPKYEEPEQIVIHAKSSEEYRREATHEETPTEPKKKSAFSFSDNMGAATFNTDRATDSMSDLEQDRLKQEREINKKNVFSVGQKFKTGRKDIARLNGKINPFEREVSLKQEFEETVFFEFIEQLSEKTGIDYKLILNDSTYEIPVIDFESGLRLICSDLNEPSLVNAHYEWINPRVPFSFFESYAEDDGTGVLKKKRKKYKWCVLFSDSVDYARDATFAALVKYINPKILAYEGKKVVLQDNLMFQYTKHNQYLRDFDKRNSTFPSRKPTTGSLGIIARWNSSSQATAKDVLKFKLQMESVNGNVANLDTLANNYNEYMVASIKYIEQFNKETNRVIYTITEYVEVGSSIIADGFAQCLRALLKEYVLKYPQLSGIDPFVLVEVDPSTFPSPSLYSYVERGTLCKVDNAFKGIMTGQPGANQGVDRTFRFSYVRRPEYRRNNEIDHMRQDRRMFTTGSLIVRMAEEIKAAGLSNTIRDPNTKKQFIANMGYVEATQPETKLYFVNRSVLATLMVDGYTMSLQEHIDENNFNATKMVDNSNVGIGVNNVMMNPNLMMKWNNIMQNGSAEAKDYFNRMVQEDYQQRVMDMMMNSQGQPARANVQNQQFGMNSMMGMGMGMNPMMGMQMPMSGFGMNQFGMGMPNMGF